MGQHAVLGTLQQELWNSTQTLFVVYSHIISKHSKIAVIIIEGYVFFRSMLGWIYLK